MDIELLPCFCSSGSGLFWCLALLPDPRRRNPRATLRPPPGLIKLTGDDARRAETLNSAIKTTLKADHWAEAIARQEELVALRSRVQGPTHFETVNEQWNLRPLRRVAGMPSEDRSAFLSVDSLSQGADSLSKKAQYGAAQPLYQKALAIRRKVLGEDHPSTAQLQQRRGQPEWTREVRGSGAALPEGPGHQTQGPGRRPPEHGHQLQRHGGQPPFAGKVCGGGAAVPEGPGYQTQDPG